MQQMPGKFAPAQLAQVAVDIGIAPGTTNSLQHMGDAPRCNLAKMQVGRDQGGTDTVRQVALFAVTVERTVGEHLQRLLRTGLAGLPALPETGIPSQSRRQAQCLQGQSIDPMRGQHIRRSAKLRQTPAAQRIAPERREYLVGAALLGRQLPGFEQQIAVVAFHLQSLLAQIALDRRITRLGDRLVLAVPVHRLGAGFGDQLLQCPGTGAAADDQMRTTRTQIGIQRGE